MSDIKFGADAGEQGFANRSCLVRFSIDFTTVQKTDKFFSSVSVTYILVPGTTMKRGIMGSSKKEHADSRTIRKSTREESIDTLQAASIDIVNQASSDTIQPLSDNTVHYGTVHSITVHPQSVDTFHPASIDTVHRDTVHLVQMTKKVAFLTAHDN